MNPDTELKYETSRDIYLKNVISSKEQRQITLKKEYEAQKAQKKEEKKVAYKKEKQKKELKKSQKHNELWKKLTFASKLPTNN